MAAYLGRIRAQKLERVFISWSYRVVDKRGSMSQIQPPPDSANEGLLGRSQVHCFCIAYGYFHTTRAVVNSCDRDPTAHRAQYIYYLTLYRKGPDLWSRTQAYLGDIVSSVQTTSRKLISQ